MLRERKGTVLFILLGPSVFIVLLYWLQVALSGTSSATYVPAMDRCHRFDAYGNEVSACVGRGGGAHSGGMAGALCGTRPSAPQVLPRLPCVSVGYAPTSPDTDRVMRRLAKAAGWDYGVGVRGFPDTFALVAYIYNNIGTVEWGVSFIQFDLAPDAVDNLEYELWENTTGTSLLASAGFDDIQNNYGCVHAARWWRR